LFSQTTLVVSCEKNEFKRPLLITINWHLLCWSELMRCVALGNLAGITALPASNVYRTSNFIVVKPTKEYSFIKRVSELQVTANFLVI